MVKPGRAVAVTLGVLAALLAWLTAVPLAHQFNGLAPGDLPWAPDAWARAYDGVYETVGEPLGLSVYYFWGKPAFLLYAARCCWPSRSRGAGAAGAAPAWSCCASRSGSGWSATSSATGAAGGPRT